ncbi:hypothetical protein HPP92_024013 [Vanilla planifolia]|uniref:Dof zinc finger protein n=1 Tax=Vanilla planifolia TaxID=51239 RepID=A0A835UCW3_VANPL|nr:hypothetical protein HPP92_024013 [Vanilla planifolia]
MQGTTTTAAAAAGEGFPEQRLQCPRCESNNTKFCYYNNYNLSQPRHFCKDCRRYWTKGGALRNVPVGGGSRKSSKRSSPSCPVSDAADPKRPSSANSASLSSSTARAAEVVKVEPSAISFPQVDNDHRLLDITGSFSSLLSSPAHFGGPFFDLYHSAEGPPFLRSAPRPLQEAELQSSAESGGRPPEPENFLSLQGDSGGWGGGWPDLSIYTPGGSYQ